MTFVFQFDISELHIYIYLIEFTCDLILQLMIVLPCLTGQVRQACVCVHFRINAMEHDVLYDREIFKKESINFHVLLKNNYGKSLLCIIISTDVFLRTS